MKILVQMAVLHEPEGHFSFVQSSPLVIWIE